jgi:hypothetical protein
MLEFLIDNIFVSFGGTLFQQVVGISMGTNCAPLLADLFLYSHINNSRFAEFLPLIYPPELEVKETTDTASFASFFGLVPRN